MRFLRHAAAPNSCLFVCGIEPRTDAPLLGCPSLCTVSFRNFRCFFSAFVKEYIQPYMTSSTVLKNSLGDQSPLGHLEEIKTRMGPPANGTFSGPVRMVLNKCSGTLAASIVAQLKEAASLMCSKS